MTSAPISGYVVPVMLSSHRTLISSLALAAVLLAACGDDDDTAATAPDEDVTTTEATAAEASDEPAAAGDTVTIERSRFAPDPLEVAAGTEVTFENVDPFAHTVTSAEDSPLEFDSAEFGQDETFTQTFDEAGTYAYFCQIHPTMRAEVVVS